MAAQTVMYHQGPLPTAEQLQQYNDVCPGAADRIIKMAEEQIAHRQYLEKQAVKTQCQNGTLGVLCGFFLGCLAIVAGVVVSLYSDYITGFATIFIGLASLVGVFVYGKQSNKKEFMEKQKIMNQMQR